MRSARTVVAAVLSVLTAILAPLSVVSAWAWSGISDTDRFVASYAGLARSPQVQTLVTAKVSGALTAGLGVLGDNTVARDLVGQAIGSVVTSDAFTVIWEQSLRSGHAQLRALLADEPGAVEAHAGMLYLELAPFAAALKQRLQAAGVPFVDILDRVTGSVPLLQLDSGLVAQARGLYRVLEVLGVWLPWLALLVGVAAALLWPGVRRGLIVTGSLLVLSGAAGVTNLGRFTPLVSGAVAEDLRPVVALLLETATAPLVSPLSATLVTGLVLAFTGLMSRRPVPTA